MTNVSRTLLIAMIAIYILVVRAIPGWAYFLRTGDTYVVRLSFSSIAFWCICLVAVVCIWGLLNRRWWAWWLTAALSAYELVSYVSGQWWLTTSQLHFDFGPNTLGLVIKPLWLLAIIALALLCRLRRPLR
jgi:hypothetical protein